MALFKHSYSGLITKGLGMSACCGMLTMGFGVFFCKIEVIDPQPPYTGGGSFARHPGIYVPWKPKVGHKTKQVQVTVKFSEDRVWRRMYTVSATKGDIVVKAIEAINLLGARVKVGVQQLKRTAARVSAIFTSSDK